MQLSEKYVMPLIIARSTNFQFEFKINTEEFYLHLEQLKDKNSSTDSREVSNIHNLQKQSGCTKTTTMQLFHQKSILEAIMSIERA